MAIKKMISKNDIENLEIKLMLDAIDSAYGYSFHNYTQSSLRRRINEFKKSCQAESYLHLADKLLNDQSLFEKFLKNLSITVTEMFRDPQFYQSFRKNIVPTLETYPFIKIWSAGCATGEEIYSIAIILHESGLLDRSTLYATDFNTEALVHAKKGIYSATHTQTFINNYNRYGGKNDFSNYYTAKYDSIKLKNFLIDKITFANHNLVVDSSFGEMNVILCRNVMIYFDSELTNRVLNLLQSSLCRKGFLCIGTKESLEHTNAYNFFNAVDNKMKIYQLR